MGDSDINRWFTRFEKHKYLYIYSVLFIYLIINAAINATSVLMEDSRDGVSSIDVWEPIVWELTSAVSVMLILPAMFFFFSRFKLGFYQIKRQILVHIFASLIVSLVHVSLMVGMREGIYWFVGGNYDFSPWLREFGYEYRKDAWGYVFWLVSYHIVVALYRRLKGEASLIKNQQEPLNAATQDIHDKDDNSSPEHLLVRKLDKEFLVKVNDIEWLEAAGNYVNLYQQGRIYPLRGTLANTVERLAERGFSRIHRSFAVNHNAIDNIQYMPSGDGVVTLKCGRQLSISRRYKLDFKNAVS